MYKVRNVSLRNSIRLPIHIISSVDKSRLSRDTLPSLPSMRHHSFFKFIMSFSIYFFIYNKLLSCFDGLAKRLLSGFMHFVQVYTFNYYQTRRLGRFGRIEGILSRNFICLNEREQLVLFLYRTFRGV